MNTESHDVLRWILSGENVGLSSKAMACHLIGESTSRPDAHPYDPEDLWRCLMLLRRIPTLKSRLHRVAEISEQWARLIEHWDELESLLKSEIGDNLDFSIGRSAPRTYERMRQLLYPVAASEGSQPCQQPLDK
jgi:hypothetical protein